MDIYLIKREVQHEGEEVVEVWTKNGDEAVERASHLQSEEELPDVRFLVEHWKVTPKVPGVKSGKVLYVGAPFPPGLEAATADAVDDKASTPPAKQAIAPAAQKALDIVKGEPEKLALPEPPQGLIPLGPARVEETPQEILDMFPDAPDVGVEA